MGLFGFLNLETPPRDLVCVFVYIYWYVCISFCSSVFRSCDCKSEDLIGGNLMTRLDFGMEASAGTCSFGSRDFRPA